MSDPNNSTLPSRGRITTGPEDSLVSSTISFVYRELAGWRDDPERDAGETEHHLNPDLVKYLDARASEHLSAVSFSNQERQAARRQVDFSAGPKKGMFVSGLYHSIYTPFLVFECKLLPAPTKDREREYLTGGEEITGGIQRFKLALHGGKHSIAVMIGYIQENGPTNWFTTINEWIRELALQDQPGKERWSAEEQLTNLAVDPELQTAMSSSTHQRIHDTESSTVTIRHLWVVMQQTKTGEKQKRVPPKRAKVAAKR